MKNLNNTQYSEGRFTAYATMAISTEAEMVEWLNKEARTESFIKGYMDAMAENK